MIYEEIDEFVDYLFNERDYLSHIDVDVVVRNGCSIDEAYPTTIEEWRSRVESELLYNYNVDDEKVRDAVVWGLVFYSYEYISDYLEENKSIEFSNKLKQLKPVLKSAGEKAGVSSLLY